MEFKVSRLVVIYLMVTSFYSCAYNGPGVYSEDGKWLFKNYKLILPEFPLAEGFTDSYKISGFKSNTTTLVYLVLESDELVDTQELDTIVEISIFNKSGNLLFHKYSSLNSHYVRMKLEGKASWQKQYEWHTDYKYGDNKIDRRAIPFMENELPMPSTRWWYYDTFESSDRKFLIEISVLSDSLLASGITGKIILSSGWK